MSNHFQTQNQWENDIHPIGQSAENKRPQKKSVVLHISKRALVVLGVALVLLLTSIISLSAFARRIEGVWVRQEDDTQVAGMTVEVVNNNGVLEGHIIAMPAGAPMFEVGQVKWNNIQKTGFGQYECDSLFCTSNGVYHYTGDKSVITVLAGGEKLTMVSTFNDPTATGKYQVWVKQK